MVRAHPSLILLVAFAAACADAVDPVERAEVPESYRPVLDIMEDAGYRGPVLVRDWRTSDRSRLVTGGRSLALPAAGLLALERRRSTDAAFGPQLAAALAQAEVTDPEQIDPAHNSPSADLVGIVLPSVLNGPSPTRSEIRSTNRFLSYDYENDRWYVVQAAIVDSSKVVARDSSGGHFHGTAAERSLRRRVGWLEPEAGSFSSGTWTNTWKAPEYAQEVSFRYYLVEIGGPNDGMESTFYSLENSATRLGGLGRIPASGDGSYVRVGGTNPHPEDFNDWGVPGLISGVTRTAADYHRATGDVVRVNDMSLFFGGRFDLDANFPEGRASHQEHRFGTEIDFRPSDMTPAQRARFVKAAEGKFASMIFEGDHYHARAASSYYNR